MSGLFKAISFSYKTASLELRSKIALDEAECKALLLHIKEVTGVSEALILSTCNRTEIYYSSEDSKSDVIIKLLAVFKGVAVNDLMPHALKIETEADAIQYLFEVGTGLHSQVVGDLQIPNQIKHAYQYCADMNMAGAYVHRLMHTLFYVNKRVVQETRFRDGAASTSYAAVETIEVFLPLLPDAKILVLGLGEIGEDVVKTLNDKGYTNFTVANRTKAKADALASEMNFTVLPFESVKEEIKNFDIVISSIRTEQPFIDLELVKDFGHNSIKYFIDLSVPRSIDPAIESMPGMVLYDLDEIQNRANAALELRKSAIPDVMNIIRESAAEFADWSEQMVVSPTIQKLKGALEQIRKEEMAKFTKSLNQEELAKVERITISMMQKVIKLPVIQLKAACKRGEAETLIDVLNDLFNLEKVES